MLRLKIKGKEFYDDVLEEFVVTKDQTLVLEHSLVSLSKWESKWKKPFWSKDKKSTLESLDYVRCMTITQNVPDETYLGLSDVEMSIVNEYIEDSMTATTFSNLDSETKNREIITSEIIYYWMIALDIPVEFQKWHISRLLTLIQVCNVKNAKPKKLGRRAIANRNSQLNKQRREAMKTKG